jgi:hypothetical protein
MRGLPRVVDGKFVLRGIIVTHRTTSFQGDPSVATKAKLALHHMYVRRGKSSVDIACDDITFPSKVAFKFRVYNWRPCIQSGLRIDGYGELIIIHINQLAGIFG